MRLDLIKKLGFAMLLSVAALGAACDEDDVPDARLDQFFDTGTGPMFDAGPADAGIDAT